MAKFLVCASQDGGGCDYSIGCGMIYDIMEAETLLDAIDKIIWPDGDEENSSLEGDFALSEILIIPADNIHTVDVEYRKQQVQVRRKRQELGHTTANEKAELVRLKAKYE